MEHLYPLHSKSFQKISNHSHVMNRNKPNNKDSKFEDEDEAALAEHFGLFMNSHHQMIFIQLIYSLFYEYVNQIRYIIWHMSAFL